MTLAPDLDAFEQIARRRRSVRAFRSLPVPRILLERAVEAAGTAPSSCNTQPWRLVIASGHTLSQLRDSLSAAAAQGRRANPDVPSASPYEGEARTRQIDAAVRLFAAQGVVRGDSEGRRRSFLRNYAFFDAPHVALLFLPEQSGLREAADAGKFAQTFMLALAAAGVGSCPQGSLSDYPDIVREVLAMEPGEKLLLGLSVGYADEDNPSASVRPPRRALSDLACFAD